MPREKDSIILVNISKWFTFTWFDCFIIVLRTLPGKKVLHRDTINVAKKANNEACRTGNLLCAAGSNFSRTKLIITDKSSLSLVYSTMAVRIATKSCIAVVDFSLVLKIDSKNSLVTPREHASIVFEHNSLSPVSGSVCQLTINITENFSKRIFLVRTNSCCLLS